MEYILQNIDPIAFSIGPLVIRWYALAYLAGFLLGWRYCIRIANSSQNDRPNADDIDNLISWIVVGVILGGRLGYVLFYNFEYYSANPVEILKIWSGGMSFHGGLLGVAVSMVLFSKRYKINIVSLSDIVCAAAPIGLFFGRIANFINAELYGRVTSHSWGVIFPGAGELPRHPSQLYEAALEGAVLFAVLYLVIKFAKPKAGVISAVFLMGYGIFRASIELVREPDMQIGLIGSAITMGQVLCVPMIIAGAILLYLALTGKLSFHKA